MSLNLFILKKLNKMENSPITIELVEKLIDTVSYGLSSGLGLPEPGKMCVEAAVCYAYGIPHSDNPPCVGAAVREYKIRLNDSNWSTNKARGEGMLALSIAQLNSNILDQKEFSRKIVLKTINTIIADLAKEYAPKLEGDLRTVTDFVEAKNLCNKLNAVNAAAAYAAVNAAYAADAAAAAAADAADAAAAYAAYAAAYAADATAADAVNAAKRDEILNKAAQNCLEVLQEMNSPGCEYLYLIKK
jgi:hypothetical protein